MSLLLVSLSKMYMSRDDLREQAIELFYKSRDDGIS